MISMCDMELDREGIIKKIDVGNDMERRYMDIGIVPGGKITRVYEDFSKSISCYMVMDSFIAIRNKDSKGIMVSYE